MGDLTPIVAGALYESEDLEKVRVKSVWIDEDKTVQIQAFTENGISTEERKPRTISMDNLIERIESGDLDRINTDYDAWEYRNY